MLMFDRAGRGTTIAVKASAPIEVSKRDLAMTADATLKLCRHVMAAQVYPFVFGPKADIPAHDILSESKPS
jgi:hypothetical protein